MLFYSAHFSLIVEALSGHKVTVGAPFFDQISIPLWLATFALMGIGPLLPWRKAHTQSLLNNLAIMLVSALLSAMLAYFLGIRKVYPLITLALAGYNLASLYLLIAGALRPRIQLSGRSAASVFKRYAFENRRRFGSMVVHFAIIIIALGVTGAGGYRIDEQVRIGFGESISFKGYELKALDRFMERTTGRISAGALIEVSQKGRVLKTLKPRINVFSPDGTNAPQPPVPTPAILYKLQHDLYLNIVGTVGPDQDYVVLRVVQSPFVVLVWLGGFIIALGTIYSLLPNSVLQKESKFSGELA